MRRILECTGALFFLTAGLHAGERLILTTGFEIHADRHEIAGDHVRVYDGNGVTELPATLISEFLVEEYTTPKPESVANAPTASAPVSERPPTPKELIRLTVEKHKLPKELVSLVESVMKQESGFHVHAISPKGAIGLMQLMPGTARQFGVDPLDPAQNIDAGTRYLTALLTRYRENADQVVRALAAYNAGPGAVDRYGGVPPYRETRDYVRRVVRNYLNEQKATGGI